MAGHAGLYPWRRRRRADLGCAGFFGVFCHRRGGADVRYHHRPRQYRPVDPGQHRPEWRGGDEVDGRSGRLDRTGRGWCVGRGRADRLCQLRPDSCAAYSADHRHLVRQFPVAVDGDCLRSQCEDCAAGTVLSILHGQGAGYSVFGRGGGRTDGDRRLCIEPQPVRSLDLGRGPEHACRRIGRRQGRARALGHLRIKCGICQHLRRGVGRFLRWRLAEHGR